MMYTIVTHSLQMIKARPYIMILRKYNASHAEKKLTSFAVL